MAIFSGTVTIGETPTQICTVGQDGALVVASATGVWIGGANVAISGANAGVPLPTTPVTVPGAAARMLPSIGAGQDTAVLYGISNTGAQTVSWLTAATGSGT
jgi:hypothetical protein